MISTIIEGKFETDAAKAQRAESALKKYLRQSEIEGFVEALVHDDLGAAFNLLIQGSGLGVLRHNSIVIGWPAQWATTGSHGLFFRVLRVSVCSVRDPRIRFYVDRSHKSLTYTSASLVGGQCCQARSNGPTRAQFGTPSRSAWP